MRVRATHTFDLRDAHGNDVGADEAYSVVGSMSVQAEEPVWYEDGINEVEGTSINVRSSVLLLDFNINPVQAALEAFWSTIADLHPQITTGDLDPGTRVRFDRMADEAVTTWLRYNNPQGG